MIGIVGGRTAAEGPAVRGTDITPGLLQKVFGRHGVLLIPWEWNGRQVAFGIWFTDRVDQGRVRGRIEARCAVGQYPGGNRKV